MSEYQYYEFCSLNKPVMLILLPDTGHVPTNPNIIYDLNLKVSNWLDKVIHEK